MKVILFRNCSFHGSDLDLLLGGTNNIFEAKNYLSNKIVLRTYKNLEAYY